ncbi:hypothetical protein V1515DRAFT_535973, partial [Lipomyces mesembrius]
TQVIAVEVGISLPYENWWLCVDCTTCLGIAMFIHEENGANRFPCSTEPRHTILRPRLRKPKKSSSDNLLGSPYGPLVWNEVTWMGKISRVELATYRRLQEENYTPETLLRFTRSFLCRFVGGDVPPNLHELVLGDYIPSHILTDGVVEARPLNFFERE